MNMKDSNIENKTVERKTEVKNKTTKSVKKEEEPKRNILHTEESVDLALVEIINKEFTNKQLIKHLNDVFSEKGLNQGKVSCLFNKEQTIRELTSMERMAFVVGCYDVLKLSLIHI